MSTHSFPSEAQLARRAARRALIRRSLVVVVGALLVFAVVHAFQKQQTTGSTHVATKLVTVLKAEKSGTGRHITAQLDAPSPNGTSHQIEGVIPETEWKLSKTVWACYPPTDPDKGTLRSPLDAGCADLVARR